MNNEVEIKIREINDKISLPVQDKELINELLDNNEWGVALETICGAIFEDNIEIIKEIYLKIEEVGKLMKMNPETWEILKELTQ